VDLVNRFLSVECTSRDRIQLAGTACLWVAAKYEEVACPNAQDFATLSVSTPQQLVAMEECVLSALQHRLALPTARLFQLVGRASGSSATRDFLVELSLLDKHMLGYQPSLVAAASTYLARVMQQQQPAWDFALASCSRCSLADVQQAAAELAYAHLMLTDSALLARHQGMVHIRPCTSLLERSCRFGDARGLQSS
jgi:hypothetical protein